MPKPRPDSAAPLIETASRLVRQAGTGGAVVRVCGSLGIRLLPGPGAELLDRVARKYKDIDLVTRRQDRNAVRQIFARLDAEENPQVRIASEGRRFAYVLPPDATMVDLFVDELDFCHRLDLSDRLEETELTLAPADLFLQKAQIVKLTDRDELDLVALLLSCPAGEAGERVLSLRRLGAVLAGDWGFHHTVEGNLLQLERRLPEWRELSPAEGRQAAGAVRELLEFLRRMPKTIGYRLRALVGTRVRWYVDVSDEATTF